MPWQRPYVKQADTTPPATKPPWQDVSLQRSLAAAIILGAGIVGLTAVAIVAIWGAGANGKTETTRYVFASITPLLGTWVGAVIAFYFNRDNLLAGSQTALAAVNAVGGLNTDRQVTEVMIPLNQINPSQNQPTEAAAHGLVLVDLYQGMRTAGSSRTPVMVTGKPRYVIHERDIDKYAQSLAPAQSSASLDRALIVQSMIDVAELKAALTSFVCVAATNTVGEARAKMQQNPTSTDIFVTTTGDSDGTVIGWLTNSDLARTTQ